MNRHSIALLVAGLLCLYVAAPARAAESYDNCTGFIQSLPATISSQGVWCLRGDLATAITGGAAITIAANNVTIDCNGFKLGGLMAGAATEAKGIEAVGRLNGTVRNCGIRGFRQGVLFSGAASAGHLVEDNRFDQNRYVAVFVQGEANRVQRNRVTDMLGSPATSSGSYGIAAAADILDNSIDVVTSPVTTIGIQASGFGTLVRGNQVRGLDSTARYGIFAAGVGVVVAENQVLNQIPGEGVGILGFVNTVCRDNVVSGYTTAAIQDCPLGSGNVTLP